MDFSVKQVKNGYILSYEGGEWLVEDKSGDTESEIELKTVAELLFSITQVLEVFNSKHNSHRLNIEVVKQNEI